VKDIRRHKMRIWRIEYFDKYWNAEIDSFVDDHTQATVYETEEEAMYAADDILDNLCLVWDEAGAEKEIIELIEII
jgi:hypothetical protein